MKTILCFGDSNTWGYIPGTDAWRFVHDVRWTGVLAAKLGGGFRVVEEGLNGRTTCWDDPIKAGRRGLDHLPTLLESHAPIDLIVIMLGTNDLKHYLGLSANDIALGAGKLVETVQLSDAGPVVDGRKTRPAVLLVSPAHAVEAKEPFGTKFDEAVAKSQDLGAAYRLIAHEYGVSHFDAASVAHASDVDGVHLDAAAHASLGAALAGVIADLL
ncbi:MAG: hypothetical protein GC159_15555 [Phycisphaera sp.]|nr:hypothetical protein [Phycisphaera sp.]